MTKRALCKPSGHPSYSVLDPVVDLLISHGNVVISTPRWCCNPTGYYCLLGRAVDFELIEREFEIPDPIILFKELGVVDYGLGSATISQK